jgi:hypothetical protein
MKPTSHLGMSPVYARRVNLTEQLQRASDLAVVQQITTLQRKRAELSPDHREFLKGFFLSWWAWVMQQALDKEEERRLLWRGQLTELFAEAIKTTDGKEALDKICMHLWLNTELLHKNYEYLQQIVIDLRGKLLMEASRRW